MKKRGQATLEFLFTYGWAILAVLISIGALAYFGVLNPSSAIPEYCITETGINCDDFTLYDTGHIFLEATNLLGVPIKDILVKIEDANGNIICILEGQDVLQPGEQALFTTTQASLDDPNCKFEEGELVDLGVSIDYQTTNLDGSDTSHEILGDIIGMPIDGPPSTPIDIGLGCGDNICSVDEDCNTCESDCGICGGTDTPCVGDALNCNDNNLCTTDSCDPNTGCVSTPVSCPLGQVCSPSTGQCAIPSPGCVTNADCNDNNACTTDGCVGGNCQNSLKDCDDNNACTTDSCNPSTGQCGSTSITCNDNNLCTTDSCNPSTGCVSTPISCPIGRSCNPSTGTCPPNVCRTNSDCNDNNACTTDVCDSGEGACQNTAISCNDGNACTNDGTCNSGSGCPAKTSVICNDGNLCTIDSCNPSTGCTTTSKCSERYTCVPSTGACIPTR